MNAFGRNGFRATLSTGAIALAFALPAFADDTGGGAMSTSTQTFNFAAQNGSGETGQVTLKPTDNGTIVSIKLKGAPADAQPAHIHPGTCANLDPKPLYPLNNVVNGVSTTTVNQPISKLTGGGYAVNVHKSTNDLATYVACADLKVAPAAPSGTSSPASKM